MMNSSDLAGRGLASEMIATRLRSIAIERDDAIRKTRRDALISACYAAMDAVEIDAIELRLGALTVVPENDERPTTHCSEFRYRRAGVSIFEEFLFSRSTVLDAAIWALHEHFAWGRDIVEAFGEDGDAVEFHADHTIILRKKDGTICEGSEFLPGRMRCVHAPRLTP